MAGHQVEILDGVTVKRTLLVDNSLGQAALHRRPDVESQPGRAGDFDAVESVAVGGGLVPLVVATDANPDFGGGGAGGVADGAGEGEGSDFGFRISDFGLGIGYGWQGWGGSTD